MTGAADFPTGGMDAADGCVANPHPAGFAGCPSPVKGEGGPAAGAFDGIYRFVTLHDLPEWLGQGWTLAFVTPPYGACVRAPGDSSTRKE